MRTLIVAVAIILLVAIVSEGRRSTCNRKTFWKVVFNRNNRISREAYRDYVTGRSWFTLYTINFGELVASFRKAEHRHLLEADGTERHEAAMYVEEIPGCVFYNLTGTVVDRKVCRHGAETQVEINTSFDAIDETFPASTTYFSQDPRRYILQHTCVDAVRRRRCNRGFIFIQVPGARGLCGDIDLIAVPWHKVAFDLYSLTGLKFGDPRVIYTWLGTGCYFPGAEQIC